MALMLLPMIGALGLGAEASNFFLNQRAMQNAADVAVIAAASNGCAASDACHTTALMPTYDTEAKAVASTMGFADGGNVAVAASNAATCPGGGSNCYSVTITRKVPVYLLSVVDFVFDATSTAGGPAQTVKAVAVALNEPGTQFCITALGAASDAIAFKGSSRLDLTGCYLASNGGASCNAHTGDTIRYSYVNNSGDKKDCGSENLVSEDFANAFYAGLASHITSADTACGAASATNTPQSPRNGGSKDTVDAAHTLSTAASVNGTKCGDVKLGGDVTVTSDSTLTIYDGRLDLAGHTLMTASGAHLTIVLAGHTLTSGSISPDHIIMSSVNGAVINIAAPKADGATWQGVAIYQAPNLTGAKNKVDFTVSGNNPQFDITGLVYAPLSNVTIDGAINHATEGDACLAFIVKTLQIAGTGSLFANPTVQCDRAGLTQLNRVNDKAILVG